MLPPFVKISLSFARTTAGRPYRVGGGFDVVIVGTVRPYLLRKLTVLVKQNNIMILLKTPRGRGVRLHGEWFFARKIKKFQKNY